MPTQTMLYWTATEKRKHLTGTEGVYYNYHTNSLWGFDLPLDTRVGGIPIFAHISVCLFIYLPVHVCFTL